MTTTLERKERFMKTLSCIEKSRNLLRAIEYFEGKRDRHLKDAQGWLLHFDGLRQKAIHKADICRRAIERLEQTFDNLLSEIHLKT